MFGDVELHVQEPTSKVEIIDADEDVVKKVKKDKDNTADIILPSLPPVEGLTLIDGEYCDIQFDEESFVPGHNIPVVDTKLELAEYIDTQSEDFVHKEITKESKGKAIEVAILSRGNIISLQYFPVKNKTYYISSLKESNDTVTLNIINQPKKVPFIKVKNGTITVMPVPDVECIDLRSGSKPFSDASHLNLGYEDSLSFYQKTVQMMVRVVDAPPELKYAPFFKNDNEFNKHVGIAFSVLFSIMAILLMVDITQIKEEEEKPAIIYKKPKVQKEVKNISDKMSDNGTVEKNVGLEKEQPKKDTIAKAKKEPPKKTVTKKEVVKKKQKQLAKTETKKPIKKKVKKVAKVKSYQFKMKSTVKSLFGASKNLGKVKLNNNTKTISDSKGFQTSAEKASSNNLKKDRSLKVGKLGDSTSGKYDKSYGTKGLGLKKGIDTSYVDPKTVILGSMDPELLRKILQEYMPQFQHCYQQELEINEKLKGVVDLNFTIGKTGRVVKMSVKPKNNRFSRSGVKCMANVLKLIKFPKPKGGGQVSVRQPLNFYSEKSKF